MSEDAAFEVFAKSQSVEDRAGSLRVAAVCPARSQNAWCVVVTLAVELAATGQFMPGLEVFGHGLVEQSPLGGGAGCRAWALHPLARPRENASALGGGYSLFRKKQKPVDQQQVQQQQAAHRGRIHTAWSRSL